jgi:hypothetical protein
VLKTLRAAIQTKKKIIDVLDSVRRDNDLLKEVLDKNIISAVNSIKELKQDKIYFLKVDSDSFPATRRLIDEIKKHIKWTIPNIIVMNKDLIELSREEILKEVK